MPFGQGLAGLAAETGEVQIGAPRYKDVEQSESMSGIKAVIAAPMMLGDRLIGVITAVSNDDDKRFTMEDAQLYACLGTIAALVVNQALLLRATSEGAETTQPDPAALADPLEREVTARVARLLQRDSGTIRQLAKMLEAVEAMLAGRSGAMSQPRGLLQRALEVPIEDLAKGELAPVTVAVLDSGIDGSHPDLAGRVAKSMIFEADAEGNVTIIDSDPTANNDLYGHGTGVASIIARIAPNATLHRHARARRQQPRQRRGADRRLRARSARARRTCSI